MTATSAICQRCDGVTRREVLRAGGLAALGLSVADWLRLRRASAQTSDRAQRPATAKACILIWLDGGPSHLETFDLKPDAPDEVRGPFSPIDTAAPGVRISEYMPATAKVMDRVAVIRSMTSTLGEHNFGAHYLLTGYKPTPVLQYPSYGAVLAHERGAGGILPRYIAVPDYNAQAGAGYLPPQCGPFAVLSDPAKPDFRVRDLSPYPGVTTARLERRREFLRAFDELSRQVEGGGANGADPEFEQAYRLITSPAAQKAFDLSSESAETRARYGQRTVGQSCLLARRLVEAGVPFVTVNDPGWDTHDRLFNRLKEGYTGGTAGKIPLLDQAFSGLIEDLNQRGLLAETIVVLMGEFGRTPKFNALGGRDHWPRVFSVALAGGGVRGGQAIGASDSRGESPAERPVRPEDLARTIYTCLGVDPDVELHTSDGRPVRINQHGELVAELIG